MQISTRCLAIVFFVVFVCGCGQDDIVFPDAGTCPDDCECDAGGDGGPLSYPPGPYGVEEGKTFPKVQWNVRINGEDAVFTSEQAYEQRDEKKALVIVVSAKNCPACEELITAIGGMEAQYSAVAVMVGMCFADLLDSTAELSLDEAETIMTVYDHWPAAWPVTNEHTQMPSEVEEGFPSVTWVRLADMQVMEVANRDYIADKGAEQLFDKLNEL